MLPNFFNAPSPEQFADLVIAEMRQDGVTGAIQFDPDTCSVTKDDGARLLLAAGYVEYRDAPFWQRPEIVRRYSELHRTGPRPETFDAIRESVLPMLMDRFSVENTRRISPQLQLPGKLIAHHLILLLAADYPDRLERITGADLRAWGLSFEQVLAVATENLWHRSNEDFVEQTTAGVFASPWRDQHDASRLALPGLIWQLPVKGDHVVSVPNRNTLLVTGSDDLEDLLMHAELTEKALAREPHPLTGIPLVLREDEWSAFLPQPPSPAHRPIRMLWVQSQGREYGEQQAMLEAENAMAGRSVDVAAFAVLEHPDKGLLSWCNWVDDGQRRWLPRTDLVAFIRSRDAGEDDVLGFATWDRTMAVVGQRLKPLSMYPQRYEATSFPSRAQLKALDLEQF